MTARGRDSVKNGLLRQREEQIVENGLLRQDEEVVFLRIVYYDKTRKMYC